MPSSVSGAVLLAAIALAIAGASLLAIALMSVVGIAIEAWLFYMAGRV